MTLRDTGDPVFVSVFRNVQDPYKVQKDYDRKQRMWNVLLYMFHKMSVNLFVPTDKVNPEIKNA